VHLVVCLKQILDPEIPPTDFRLDAAAGQAASCGSLVISIFDENALEVALQMREAVGEGKITAVCIGPETAIDALRKALSMRADEAYLIREEDYPGLDAHAAAKVLSAAIRRLPPADAVLCGRESGDWHGGMLGAFLASELDMSYTAFVASAKRAGNVLQLRRQSDDGWEMVEAASPAVLSITNDDHNVPRIPKVKDNMMAFRKQIPVWTAQDLGLQEQTVLGANSRLEKANIYVPVVDRRCEIIGGETADDRAKNLVAKLSEIRVI
jgi:electron transfer flavoprotein beta subunit